jgi:uncharacterized SAM-binding protein YcdF (DUF218 family)
MMETKDGISPAMARIRCVGLIIFVIGAILATLVGIETPALLRSIGRAWAVSDRLEPADAVAILGGGYWTRPDVAAQLYRAGLVRHILVPTVGPDNDGISEPDNLDREALTKLGIPAAAITDFGNSPSNTYEEARDLALWAEQNRVQRIIVPTEFFSSRRVRWILRHELGKVRVHVIIDPVSPNGYNMDQWWKSKAGLSDFRNEIIKYLYYRIRYWRS